MTYDPNNIFARILIDQIPSHKVYEDEHTLAFMDVMPQADGHTLVIPKKPSRNLLDAEPAVLGALMATVQNVARAVRKAFNAEGVLIQQFNEAAAGQSVFHLHFHVLPRHAGVGLRPHSGQMADQALLAAHAEKIRTALED
ncbi:MAG: HIT family protein [Aestuariivirga sp.]|uniref:HIT family protein n=1 Tax=Aestuariivirga sp. TaxID=2650926 RepID=UPI0038D0BB30